ncbi:MAG TPA: GNAT family N-acetyltransferase [Vicinamibacterales bacterium]|nr:GNAT family N-acetyltransferase [Vicinamibacterales bacterium]
MDQHPGSTATLGSEDLFDVVLRDGSTLALRRPAESDVEAIRQFFDELSPESRYQRFFSLRTLDRQEVARLACVPPEIGRALVGECGGRVVAFAGYYRRHPGDERAEVAFAVADRLQGRGVGTQLLEGLAERARAEGLRFFDAYVLGGNARMLDVFLESGFRVRQRVEQGVVHVELALEPTPEHDVQAARRAHVAALASMRPIFEPRAVAVVGANRERGHLGAEILHNLLAAGFRGVIYPVHPSATEIQGVPAYPSLRAVPGPVDLAVIAVPAGAVLDVVEDGLAVGVRAFCVISAGFGEAGPEGRARERALVAAVRRAGCRLVGPNCMGVVNTDPAVRLNATFSPVYPPAGGVAMSTQSGALGLAILDYARRLDIGISSFVSVGNKADVSGNDLIQYWEEDPRTRVILLYLESFGNPRIFSRLARRVSRRKPIVAVKAGRSPAGARAASSHTGALATADAVVDALFRQTGIIRTATLEELFDVAALLARQPVPPGRRVAILTNAGGPGILAADACEANGLELAPLDETTVTALRSFLPAEASVGNPVDMLASAPADHYARALRMLLADAHVDSVLTIFIPPVVTDPAAVARAVGEAAAASEKPVLAIFMRAAGAPSGLGAVPCYSFPESAAVALARAAAYGEWRRQPQGAVPAFSDLRMAEVRAVVAGALRRGGGWLTPDEAQRLVAAIGLEVAPARMVRSADEAVQAAADIGYPVALKAMGPTILHKTERNAVHLGLEDARAVRAAAAELVARLGGEMSGLLVQAMVPDGIEMLVGGLQDPMFGPVVACGSGGILAELVADTVFRLCPLTDVDAAAMIDELRSAKLLRGYRGRPAADAAALRETLLRVSTLLDLCPEILELDLNPLKVLPVGARAVDVRVRVGRGNAGSDGRRVRY